MAISTAIMLRNGQASQRMDVRLFMSLYALFNLYIYLMSYLYSPSTTLRHGRGTNFQSVEAEKERQEIMKSFYETEL